ncbi:unnamed protein product [Effrenium voratum]|nr:unnamed protein product [Effrenium voratum]
MDIFRVPSPQAEVHTLRGYEAAKVQVLGTETEPGLWHHLMDCCSVAQQKSLEAYEATSEFVVDQCAAKKPMSEMEAVKETVEAGLQVAEEESAKAYAAKAAAEAA